MLWKKPLCRGCTGLYVGLIRWLRLLPSLSLYRGLYSLLCYFYSFGPVLLVVWHACVLGRQEDNERTRRRENPGEGQKEERRRQGGQEKTGGRPGRGPSPPKLQDYFRGFGMFYSIVFHSIRFDLNSATGYVFYSYLLIQL